MRRFGVGLFVVVAAVIARVLHASVLRARAGRLRDDGGVHPDWPQVATLLLQSYRELHAAVQ